MFEYVFVLLTQSCINSHSVLSIRQRYLRDGLMMPLGPEWLPVYPGFLKLIERFCDFPLEESQMEYLLGTQCAVMLIQGEKANQIINELNGDLENPEPGTIRGDFGHPNNQVSAVYSSAIEPRHIPSLFTPNRDV